MINRRTMGILIGALWLAGIFVLGASLPSLEPVEIKIEDMPIQLPNVNKPELVQDKPKAVNIMKVARQVPKDFEFLMKQYDQIPTFNPNHDPHLSADEVERYILGYDSYTDEMKNFDQNTVGRKPGLFSAIAIYGMVNNYFELVRIRSLVRINMTQEEFDWVRTRVMEAGLYCVLSALDDEQYDSPEQKAHLESLRDQMYLIVGAGAMDKKGVATFYPEKYKRFEVPRGNIMLFLEYYRRPNQSGINWSQIHFYRPTVITFNRETILAKTANNPP